METRNIPICDIFSEKKYKIPFYQRPYSWLESNMSELLLDLYNAFQKEEVDIIGGTIFMI